VHFLFLVLIYSNVCTICVILRNTSKHLILYGISRSWDVHSDSLGVCSIDRVIRRCIQSFRTGRLERELQMVKLSATAYGCITILWVSLVSFAAITPYVASQRLFIVGSVYFVTTQSGNFWIHPRMLDTVNSGRHIWNTRLFSVGSAPMWLQAFKISPGFDPIPTVATNIKVNNSSITKTYRVMCSNLTFVCRNTSTKFWFQFMCLDN
jgi:hypothetical protein